MTKVKDAPAADETIDEKAKNGKGTIWINVHKDWVKENIPFTDKKTGEAKTFNRVIIPPGTVVDGKDVSFYEFSPKFVNQNKFNANMRSIPVREDFTYTLSRTVRDENGRFVKDENGNYKTEQMKGVKATDLQAGMEKQRKEYLNSTRSVESLDDKAKAAKEQAKSQDKKEHDAPVNDKEK